jgi:AAA domain
MSGDPFDKLGDGLDAHGSLDGHRSSWTAKDLLQHRFPEPRYAVPGLLAEGLNLLAGSPKLGKSWFALNTAAAIAFGGTALDKISVEQGETLYLALEDPPRRLQSRLRLILGPDPAPEGLFFETVWPQLLDGGCEQLGEWLGEHPNCRLVVVDVFAKVRGLVNGNVNRYEADYAAMASLKLLADRHGVAILVVHHTRKASAAITSTRCQGRTGSPVPRTLCLCFPARGEARTRSFTSPAATWRKPNTRCSSTRPGEPGRCSRVPPRNTSSETPAGGFSPTYGTKGLPRPRRSLRRWGSSTTRQSRRARAWPGMGS